MVRLPVGSSRQVGKCAADVTRPVGIVWGQRKRRRTALVLEIGGDAWPPGVTE